MNKTLILARASLFASLTAAGAFLQIPIGPVPITLQTFFVYVAGTTLHPYASSLSQIIYILIGMAGIPVFAGPVKAGPGALWGPTGGYLFGFVLAAYLIARIVHPEDTSLAKTGAALVLGTVVIYLLGLVRLWLFLGNLQQAILVGIVPFLLGDAAKIVAATIVSAKVRKIISGKTQTR